MKAPLPANENERLKSLHEYEILDTDPEQEFDDITLLASHICGTPIALITLVDQDRQWFKSKIGITACETSRDVSFCAHGILETGVFAVNDTHADKRFADNPLVTGNPGIRFYAGSPLIAGDGHALGMLCVKDQVPRELSAEQKMLLQTLSRQVVVQLELRRNLAKLRQTIGQLKQTEDELRWKTAFLEAQVSSSIDGILVVDEQGKKILQNQRFTDLLKIPQNIADDKNDEKQLRWFTETTKNPQEFIEKTLYLNAHPYEISRDEIELKDGTLLDRYSSPVSGKDGKYYGRIWTFRDITERRRMESELKKAKIAAILREGAQRYNFLADTVPLILWTARPDGGLDYFNKNWFDYTGLTLELAKDWGWCAVVHPDDLQLCIERWTHSFTTGESYEMEYRFKRAADGNYRWFLGRAMARRNEAGEIVQWVGTCTDIQDQKHAETELRHAHARLESRVAERTAELAQTNDALQQQQAELRVLFDLIPAMIWFKDTKNRILRVNQRVAEIAGKRVEDIEGKLSQDIYAQDAAKFYLDDLEIINSGVPKVGLVESVRDRDGKERWVQTDKVPYCDADGKVMGIVVMALDITERKRAEETLRESEEKFRQLAENIADVFWITSPDFKTMHYISPAYEMIWGRSTASLYANPHQWVETILPEEREQAFAVFGTLMENEPEVSVEYRIARPNGTVRWIHDRGFQVRDAAGNLVRLTGIASDITERKLAEEELRLLGCAVDQSKESIMITDAELELPGPRIIFVNPAFTQMTGYSEEEAIGKSPRILQGPRTDKAVLRRLRQNLEHGRPFVGEAINYRKDGKEFNLEWQIAPIRNVGGKITHFVAIQRDITARKEAEAVLRESNEKFHQLADNITDVFWIRSPDLSEVHYVSPAFERIWGRSVDSLYANPHQWADFILPEDRERVQSTFAALTGNTQDLDIEYRIVRPDGEIRWVRVRGFQVRDAVGTLIRHTGIVTDITERKQLETRLFQSQKMETIGKLAGGIAHEFNSILTAIIGQSELLLTDLPNGSPLVKSATEIHKAAERAAALTRQLLAYGRKQILRPEILDLNTVITGMEKTLHHLMGRSVEVCFCLGSELKSIKADMGQIEQVIVNIAMNAAAAMPNGGKLMLETAPVSFDLESMGAYPELKPGEYVMLAISDTGTGMSEAVKMRIFDPFFTTKNVGQGTGLGLSTCYGIIKQSEGHISVYSELGRGTTFKIYLPQVERQWKIPPKRLDSPELPRGTETILLVEDDPALREMAATLLRQLGYTVLSAANGVEALNLKHAPSSGHVDLLFTDVVMPHMSGKELADRVRALYPLTRILFTSAYTENAIVHQGVLDKGVELLQKPFTPSALAKKFREVLDQVKVPQN